MRFERKTLGRSRHSSSHDGKTRYTGDTHASAPQATTKKRRPEILQLSQHGPHTTRKRHQWPCHFVYNVHKCNIIGFIPIPASASQLDYIYNVIYLFPVPSALHCPFLCSTTAHALQSPLLILSIALNALIIFL